MTAVRRVSDVPTASITTSAPRPRVNSRTAGTTASREGLKTGSAPRAWATSSRAAFVSTATTLKHPAPRPLQRHEPDGPRADHHHGLGKPLAHQAEDVDGIGQRLDQGALDRRDLLGQRNQARGWHSDELGEGAGPVHAEDATPRAEMAHPVETGRAAPARDQRVHHDAVTGRPAAHAL